MLGPVVCDIAGTTLTEQEIRRIRHPLTGMVILFTRNFESVEQLCALTRAIHEAKPGVLIGVDHEGGRVQRFTEGFTKIAAMRTYGTLYEEDPEAAARAITAAGFVMAAELRAVGVDFTFAPVLDLDWGHSAVIGTRSLALDPRVVTRLARALTQGMLMAGMSNCGKHFPGHGWAQADSHVALPVDERDASRIEHADAKPYSWLGIGLASVMTAHVVYPAYDEVPATFSSRILKGLLREKLHFAGFVFSDDLSMKGAAELGDYSERAHRAMQAGCDGLIVCNAPDETDAMLEKISFTADDAWRERSALLRPRGEMPSMKELSSGVMYRNARLLMDEAQERGQ
ncbi:MAG: beta-N-acetylhexosaminidase [Duodenibacillus sp.]